MERLVASIHGPRAILLYNEVDGFVKAREQCCAGANRGAVEATCFSLIQMH